MLVAVVAVLPVRLLDPAATKNVSPERWSRRARCNRSSFPMTSHLCRGLQLHCVYGLRARLAATTFRSSRLYLAAL